MVFHKRTVEDIVEEPEETLQPPGLYSVILTGVDVSTTQAGQGRLDLHFAPLQKHKKPKTVRGDIDFQMMLLSDAWEDDDKFRTAKRTRLAEKREIKPSDVKDEDIEKELQATKNRAQRQMYQVASALLGHNEFPEVPKFDREAKAFFDSQGKSFTKDQKDTIRNGAIAQACSTIADLAAGDVDLTGYVCVARVAHETFNNKTSAKVKTLYEDLPEGETLVDPTTWV